MEEPRKATLEVGQSPIKIIDFFIEKVTGYELREVIKRCNKCINLSRGISGTISYVCPHGILLTTNEGKCLKVLKKLPIILVQHAGQRKLNKVDVSSYFHNIRPRGMRSKYCERCGIFVGNGHYYTYTDTIVIPRPDTFSLSLDVCSGCYDDKIIKKVKEATPDIEDIVRFKVYL